MLTLGLIVLLAWHASLLHTHTHLVWTVSEAKKIIKRCSRQQQITLVRPIVAPTRSLNAPDFIGKQRPTPSSGGVGGYFHLTRSHFSLSLPSHVENEKITRRQPEKSREETMEIRTHTHFFCGHLLVSTSAPPEGSVYSLSPLVLFFSFRWEGKTGQVCLLLDTHTHG